MPVTRLASFRSTSMPLCDSSSTTCAPLPRTSVTSFWRFASWMPKVQSATKWRGFAIGVYGKACPITATGTPFCSRSAYGSNTGSSKSWVRTFCARNPIGASSFSTAALTRAMP